MKEKSLSRKERRRIEDRNSIVKAATQLFSRSGYHNVSMSEIAEAAEFSVGTLYKFFKTKEDLYEAIFVELADTIMTRSLQLLCEEGSVIELFEQHLKFSAQSILDNQELVRVYLTEVYGIICTIRSCGPLKVREIKEKIMNKELELIKRGIREGIFRDTSPKHLQVALSGIFESFMMDWISDPDRDPAGVDYKAALDIFLHGAVQPGANNEAK